jgi:cytochrome d ubiquinol oxidase subunit II
MFLVLAALILRPVAFKYRSKRPDAAWRNRWDWALFIGGAVPALVFGVAVGNVLTGAPFRLDSDLRSFFEGSLIGLFHPFSLLAGLLSVAMVVLHGAGWLSVKIERGPVMDRARRIGSVAAIAAILLFAVGGAMVAWYGMGFRIEGVVDPNGPSNPRFVRTVAASGAWLDNYSRYPWMVIAPVLGFAGPGLALLAMAKRSHHLLISGSSLATIGIISTVGLSMFPFILPSSIDAQSSLTVWNASSSHLTLFIMLVVTLIFLPLVLAYTAWVMKVLFGRVTLADVRTNPDFY